MGKTVVILGKTCSGKTTFSKKMAELMGIKRIVTYTSRPAREGEVDGVDYNFVSHDYMTVNRKHFIALNSFMVEPYGNCYYGVFKPDLETDENKLLVVEPSGFYQIRETYGDKNLLSLYIMSRRQELYNRYIAREPNNYLARHEAIRRLNRDDEDFEGLEFEVDHVIINKDYETSLRKIHTTLLTQLTGRDGW